MEKASHDDGLSAGAKACNRGADLADQGRTREAIAWLRKSLRLEPWRPEALCNLAELVGGAEALRLARRAVAHAPDLPIAHYTLARALLACGYRFAALAPLRAFVDLADPDDDLLPATERAVARIRGEVVLS